MQSANKRIGIFAGRRDHPAIFKILLLTDWDFRTDAITDLCLASAFVPPPFISSEVRTL